MTHSRITLSDLHIPFHDKKLLEVWMKRLEDYEWDGVDIIGDFIDCYSLSKFDSNPLRKNNFQIELDQGWAILQRIRETVPYADIRYSEGNHEDRLRKILWNKVPALAHLRNLTISELLKLEELGVTWHDTLHPYKIEDLWFTHGDLLRKHAGQSARAKSEAMAGSVLIGHCHRIGASPFTTHCGTFQAYECGHMSDPSQLDYVRNVFNWQQGWTEVHFEKGLHWVNFYQVVDRGRERVVVGPDGPIAKWRRKV